MISILFNQTKWERTPHALNKINKIFAVIGHGL